jgi:hypothetical protein
MCHMSHITTIIKEQTYFGEQQKDYTISMFLYAYQEYVHSD